MDHRWDESTRQDRAARSERDRFAQGGVARDPEVELRDRQIAEEHLRVVNQSPWSIGQAWRDQKDLYTRNASITADGYAIGPSRHPEEGSYAYPRAGHGTAEETTAVRRVVDANVHEREAWPWLNYKKVEDDPFLSHLHGSSEGGLWQRITGVVANTLHTEARAEGEQDAIVRSDARLGLDVESALAARGDIDATDIQVTVTAGNVLLEGTVADRRSKHAAEEVAEGVHGVRDVQNRLTVRHDDPTDADIAFVLPLAIPGV